MIQQQPVPQFHPPVQYQQGQVPHQGTPLLMQGNCLPGLEYLNQVNQLLIKQKVEVLEAITGYETENQYDVLNSMGQNIYKVFLSTIIQWPKHLKPYLKQILKIWTISLRLIYKFYQKQNTSISPWNRLQTDFVKFIETIF